MTTTEASRTTWREARDRGGRYLLARQRADGGFGPSDRGLVDYYKVISAYQVCGAQREANRLCNWIRKHGMTPQGDFGPRTPDTLDYYYAYFNAWVILGAHRLGQYDLSQRGMDYLMGFWDSASGGFYSSASERTAATRQDLWVVSGCGQAALCTGRMEAALGAGEWMSRLMQAQPDYPSKLYGVWSRAEGLIVNISSTDDIRYVMACDANRDQLFFNPGIAAGFLVRLHLATGQAQWLELARRYLQCAEHASDYLYRLLRAGKVGWAASMLFTLTGEEIYREMALRVGRNLVSVQSPDGSWLWAGQPNDDVTAEMVVWLDEIDQACGGLWEATPAAT